MNSYYIEPLINITEGIVSALGFLTLSIFCYYTINLVLKYGRRVKNLMDASRRLILAEAEARGIDLSGYSDYNSKQLYQILEGLIAGVDISEFLNPDLTPAQMQRIRLRAVKREDKPQFVKPPSIKDLEQLGYPSTYVSLSDVPNIKFKIVGDVCYIQNGNSSVEYNMKQFEEGILFYKAGNVSFLLEDGVIQ